MDDQVQQWRLERLSAASDKVGGDTELGRLLGYQNGQQIGHLKKGRRRITEDTVAKIEALPGFRGWFLREGSVVLQSLNNGLEGQDPEETVTVTKISTQYLPGFDGLSVPLLSHSASMGPGSDQDHEDVIVGRLSLSPDWVQKHIRPSRAQHLRFIHGYGDSMAPTFADGDVLLVDTGIKDPSAADGVYVLANHQRLFIKRVTGRLDGGFDITSDNPKVRTVQSLNGDSQIEVLGRVLWAWNGCKL